jgi:hypothetical protein
VEENASRDVENAELKAEVAKLRRNIEEIRLQTSPQSRDTFSPMLERRDKGRGGKY